MTTNDNKQYLIQTQGWVKFDNCLTSDFIQQLTIDLKTVYEKRRALQVEQGIAQGMAGTCHFVLGENTSLDTLLTKLLLHDFMCWYFNGPYILNSYGAFINQPNDRAYVSKIHRDVRTHGGNLNLLLNILILLDDFTLENGATYALSGSHHLAEKPTEDIFYQHASRLTGKAGDIIAFDSNLWHAAGHNTSTAIRRGLTLTYSRPFMKPQLDFVRFLGEDYIRQQSPELQQVLGYNARTPASLKEFYQPTSSRFYKADQG